MTGNYIYTGEYTQIIQYMMYDLTHGELSADMVHSVHITNDGAVFEVFYLDREGHKISLPEGEDDWYCPMYYYRVKRVDALTSW